MIELVGDATPEPHKREGAFGPVRADEVLVIHDACRCGWARTWKEDSPLSASREEMQAAADAGWASHMDEVRNVASSLGSDTP